MPAILPVVFRKKSTQNTLVCDSLSGGRELAADSKGLNSIYSGLVPLLSPFSSFSGGFS